MKNFVVESGDFITTSGIYRMNDHPGREITLIYGDLCRHSRQRRSRFASSALQRIPDEAKKTTADHVRIWRKQTNSC
jgi:hypothetical protein